MTSTRKQIKDQRLANFFERDIRFIPHSAFNHPQRMQKYLEPMPDLDKFDQERARIRAMDLSNVELWIHPTYKEPLLSKQQEKHLFMQMNYYKYRALRLRRETLQMQKRTPACSRIALKTIRQYEDLLKQASKIRNQITGSNLRLAPRFAKRFRDDNRSFEQILCDAYLDIFHAVDRFDISRGWRFSTYAVVTMKRNFLKGRKYESKNVARWRPFSTCEEWRDHEGDNNEFSDNLVTTYDKKENINAVMCELHTMSIDKKDTIRRQAFALKATMGIETGRPRTLDDVGREMGITKERVRQLKEAGLVYLQRLFAHENLV